MYFIIFYFFSSHWRQQYGAFNTLYLGTLVAQCGFYTPFSPIYPMHCAEATYSWCTVYHLNQILKWLLLNLHGFAQTSLWSVDIWDSNENCDREEVFSGGHFHLFLPFSAVKRNWHDSSTTHLRESGQPALHACASVWNTKKSNRIHAPVFKKLNIRSL